MPVSSLYQNTQQILTTKMSEAAVSYGKFYYFIEINFQSIVVI